MDTLFKNFYKNLYNKTNGFLPSKPLNQSMYPGDFFQIINGEMIVLGNIFRTSIINAEDCRLEYGLQQNMANWTFSDGISKSYLSSDEDKSGVTYRKQLIDFKNSGSFSFKSNNVESIKISNWSDIKDELIIKMTASVYSFRTCYIVTESAVASDWALAVSSSKEGELELAIESQDNELIDFFGDEHTKTIQARDIEYYNRETAKRPTFFKAKKLIIKQEKLESFTRELIENRKNRTDWVTDFFDYDFDTKDDALNLQVTNSQSYIMDMLEANELNPNTALLFFDFADVNLDDLEDLFTSNV